MEGDSAIFGFPDLITLLFLFKINKLLYYYKMSLMQF